MHIASTIKRAAILAAGLLAITARAAPVCQSPYFLSHPLSTSLPHSLPVNIPPSHSPHSLSGHTDMPTQTDALTGTPKNVSEMTLDPEGFVHVADDGVARSYSADGTVIDYAPLDNAQLMKFAAQLPPNLVGEREHLEEVYVRILCGDEVVGQ